MQITVTSMLLIVQKILLFVKHPFLIASGIEKASIANWDVGIIQPGVELTIL